jgi:hypothetical protein
MKAICFSETAFNPYRNKWRHIKEGRYLIATSLRTSITRITNKLIDMCINVIFDHSCTNHPSSYLKFYFYIHNSAIMTNRRQDHVIFSARTHLWTPEIWIFLYRTPYDKSRWGNILSKLCCGLVPDLLSFVSNPFRILGWKTADIAGKYKSFLRIPAGQLKAKVIFSFRFVCNSPETLLNAFTAYLHRLLRTYVKISFRVNQLDIN